MRVALLLVTVAPLALAACNSRNPAPVTEASQGPQTPPKPRRTPTPFPVPSPPKPADITPEELAGLTSRDCETVATAYFSALQRNAWDYAARFWADPVIDGARVAALFSGYVSPDVVIDDVQEEGAAGSLYCTVNGGLTDTSNAGKGVRMGELVLRRVNDVPGATEQQLRWTIQSNTFVEKLERSGKGQPA